MRSLIHSIAMLVVGVLAAPVLGQETADTAPNQFVEVAGNRIAYRVIGRGTPMVLLTRMRGTLDTWDPLFLDELAKSNRVITMDYPGVGYSTGTLPEIGDVADFVATFAEAIGLDRFVLVGGSWGGTVAERIPSAPEKIQTYLKAAATYHEDASGRLEKLKVTRTPILVISGDNDISTAVENWFALNREIPNAHLIVYPESGHAPQHQYPELAAAQIALFQRMAFPE